MCGILAIVGRDTKRFAACVEAALPTLASRGPDGVGSCVHDGCVLGHTRLAIVDVDGGRQPMVDAELSVTFNGEIYGHRELRENLMSLGHVFRTTSDTEVLLKAYRQWGEAMVERLDGMFSFAIWDDSRKTLFFARDRLGKKPLYYSEGDGFLVIASEIKAILATGLVDRSLDRASIDYYLKRMYVPVDRSVYMGIRQLPPAHAGTYSNGIIKHSAYWRIPDRSVAAISYDEAKAEVLRLLRRAVARRIDSSDVPVGAFLSGGVDSSLVAILAAEVMGVNRLQTFAVDYVGATSEKEYARAVAERIGGRHTSVAVGPEAVDGLLDCVVYFDEPHADTSDYSQSVVSELAASSVKTVLSGDGADELFFGYKWHVGSAMGSSEGNSLSRRRVSDVCVFTSEERVRLWKGTLEDSFDESVSVDFESSDQLFEISRFDLASHLPGQILSKVDRMGMMHGLEVRSPFLDVDFVEFALSLPHEFKIGSDGTQKRILRDILATYMPHDFAYRKKQGFGAPVDVWLSSEEGRIFVRECLGQDARIRTLLSGAEIDRYVEELYAVVEGVSVGRRAQKVWILVCLEKWMVANSHSK